LLNAGSNLNYTNKADLWSIGVCFYQMICGCPPFKVSSMGELQQKVKTQSGDNLSFPVDVKLSPECKSLLQKLMQADPKKRIDWNEFFTHPVFSLGKTSNAGDQQSMTQSIMFHNNKDKVQMQFAGNAQEKMDEVE
jgi:calcium-dependent protein kinase